MPKVRRKNKDAPVTNVVKRMRRTKKNDFVEEDDKARTDYDHDSMNQSNPITSISNLLRTPSPEISSLTIFEEANGKECTLETTPKNSRSNLSHRFSHRLGVNSRDSIFYQSRVCGVPLYYDNIDKEFSITDLNKSIPSDPKIFSHSEKEVKNLKNKISKEKNDTYGIFETPKLKFDSLYDNSLHQLHNEDINRHKHVGEKKILGRSKSENELVQLQGVNINPYLNYDQLQIKNFKENTVNETSFFTPELLKTKPASTPINWNLERKVAPRRPLSDIYNDIDLIINTKKSQKDSLLNRPSLTPLLNKVRASDIHNIRKNITGKSCRILSRTAPVGKIKSPRKIVHYTKGPISLHKNHVSYSYKSLIEESKSSSKDDTLGGLRKILKRLQKYGAATAKWTMSLFSVCTRLGQNLKTGISTLCTSCENNVDQNINCNCKKYQEEIRNLNVKINELSMNLVDLKTHLLENIQNNKKIETLTSTLEKMSEDVETLKLLKEEMNNLKLQFSKFSTPVSAVSKKTFAPAAPPPPPPPLPPPLPPPSAPLQFNKLIDSSKKTSSKNKAKDETPRPAISLEDILKVKLKKTSERQAPTRRINNIQPEISSEMLKQVKLRKSMSRPMTPSSLPEISSDGSTSPHSSLKRLLRDDSGFKIKRLRRVGGYSFDDIHKKNLSRLNRERD